MIYSQFLATSVIYCLLPERVISETVIKKVPVDKFRNEVYGRLETFENKVLDTQRSVNYLAQNVSSFEEGLNLVKTGREADHHEFKADIETSSSKMYVTTY